MVCHMARARGERSYNHTVKREASRKKATKASIDARARVVEDRRSRMATLIEERWGVRELSADLFMHVFSISRSTLDRDMEDLTKRGLLPRSFRLMTKKQIKEAHTKNRYEERIRELIAEGFEIGEIARKMRISRRRVKRLINGMEKRGCRRLKTATEYARARKRLKIIESRRSIHADPTRLTINPVLADKIKEMEEDVGMSLEEMNFQNLVVFNADVLENLDLKGRWNTSFSDAKRGNLIEMGIIQRRPTKHVKLELSAKARRVLVDYRAGRLGPLIMADSEEDESLARAAEGFDD